jgi:hypothetical protein
MNPEKLDLRNLLDLPERVQKSQFVVVLSKSVDDPAGVIRNYAVTGQIRDAFDLALGYVKSAIDERTNVASYLHGSFGSGKSHFMAVLSLMLGNHADVWANPDFHALRAKHEWLKQRTILRLHFNMIDAESIEQNVFGGYVQYVQAHHPEAPLPALFADSSLLTDAQALRQRIGDDAFFAGLNEGQPAAAGGGWGKLKTAQAWDASRFDDAGNSPDPEVRAQLVTALTRTYFKSFSQGKHGFVSFDEGLSAMCRHAQDHLKVDAVVLFLDELVLWLASIAADKARLTREVPKLSKLVERQTQAGGAPIVSFVARQRDIADMVGEEFIGPEHESLRQALDYWKGRFNTIELGDQNLPEIIEKRVVCPKSPQARQILDQAFAKLRAGLSNNQFGTLLGSEGSETAFRKVYPFSPVLVETLIALSHLLQRERTALKVLMELLVEHIPENMPDFQLGQVVPVGELYDVLAAGEEPMDGTHRALFRQAKRVFEFDLLPVLRAHGSGDERADQRLIKTLILAALVPKVKSLRDLTVSRLVQLNHGTVKTIVPGAESQKVASLLREWAAAVHNLRVGDGGDPTVSLVLDDIDTTKIIEDARSFNTEGARKAKLQEILYIALELEGTGSEIEHKVTWRGSKRVGLVVYGNVRELDPVVFQVPRDHDFRLVVDYPFDQAGHGPDEDDARIASLLEEGRNSPVIVWIPSFFGEKVQRALGELVIIDRIMEGDNYKHHMGSMRPDEQQRARTALDHLRNQKRALVRKALAVAYGLQSADGGLSDLDESRTIEKHFFSLYPNCQLRTPAQTDFSRAVQSAVGELMESRYPRHPYFEPADKPVSVGRLEKSFEAFERLCGEVEQRLPVSRGDLEDYAVTYQLNIVELSEAMVRLRPIFQQEIDQQLRAEGIETPTVRQVKHCLDPLGARGLLPEVADFMVRCYALVSHREILRDGRPVVEIKLGKFGPDWELVQTPLPSQTEWNEAVDRAGTLFGIAISKALNVNNLRLFSNRLTTAVQRAQADNAHLIAESLGRRVAQVPGLPQGNARLQTAEAVANLLAVVATPDPVSQVSGLAQVEVRTSLQAMQRHIKNAVAVLDFLKSDLLFNNFLALAEVEGDVAKDILKDVHRILTADELNQPLVAGLQECALRAQKLLHHRTPDGGQTPGVVPVGPIVKQGRSKAIRRGGAVEEVARVTKEAIAALETSGDDAELLLSWQIVRGGHK